MNRLASVTVYRIDEPFDKALRAVRSALTRSALGISGELDISKRIKRQVFVEFSPCRVLFVDAPYLLLEAVVLDRSAAALLPLHLVVSGRGDHTVVEWINLSTTEEARLPPPAIASLIKLQVQISRALEPIAMRDESRMSEVR